jgi:hypothetical protein
VAQSQAAPHQRSPTVHKDRVPQVFQDGAKPLDVAQVATLLGWTKDTVRAACERGHLDHVRDHPMLGPGRIHSRAACTVTAIGSRPPAIKPRSQLRLRIVASATPPDRMCTRSQRTLVLRVGWNALGRSALVNPWVDGSNSDRGATSLAQANTVPIRLT